MASKMNYIQQHKIHVLFEQLAGSLLAAQPDKPIPYLIEKLSELNGADGGAGPVVPQAKPAAAPAVKPKITLAVFGLDNAGKTTLISAIGGAVDHSTAPTVGFSPSEFHGDQWDVKMFDLGGGSKFRGIWKEYFSDVHAVLYVVDSADDTRFAEAKEAMWGILSDSRASEKPLLVFANKQDKSTAKTAGEVQVALGIQAVPRHHVFGCSAIAEPIDDNIEQGLKWALDEVTTTLENLNDRIKTQTGEDAARRKADFEEKKKRVAQYKAERGETP